MSRRKIKRRKKPPPIPRPPTYNGTEYRCGNCGVPMLLSDIIGEDHTDEELDAMTPEELDALPSYPAAVCASCGLTHKLEPEELAKLEAD